ncbi:MAG: hypothetical protein QOH10_1632 [Actinomycetota bacterium]|nr:hypothetical protein [Actinomycetota bacterium]
MTDIPRGPLDREPNEPGWWAASDGKWYPPESSAPTEAVPTVSPREQTAVLPVTTAAAPRSVLDRHHNNEAGYDDRAPDNNAAPDDHGETQARSCRNHRSRNRAASAAANISTDPSSDHTRHPALRPVEPRRLEELFGLRQLLGSESLVRHLLPGLRRRRGSRFRQ